MSDSNRNNLEQAEIHALTHWVEARSVVPEPDDMMLAAWLDGEPEVVVDERVEAWLARDPALCASLPPRGGMISEPVPEPELRRAKALVSGSTWDAGPVAAWTLRLAGCCFTVAAGIGGLAVGVALAQSQHTVEGAQAIALLGELGAVAGAW
jgi:hypothetical protein